MAPDDSTRCLRCRSHTTEMIDDGSNPSYRLCAYCQQALAGTITIIDRPLKQPSTKPTRRSTPKRTATFWKQRKAVTGR